MRNINFTEVPRVREQMTVARVWLGLAALTLAAAAVDHGMKLQQTLGSTIVVRAQSSMF